MIKRAAQRLRAASLLAGAFLVAEPCAAQVTLAKPTSAQYAYHELERIQFVCLDPCTWQGREYDNHTTALKDMTLPKLDVDQWCEAAKSWGAKEILLVSKHTGGFFWWQTETTDYSVKNIAWRDGKGDLVDEVAKACRRHGLKLGMYIYPGDDQWGARIGSGGRTSDPNRQEAYNGVLRTQWTEVLSCHRDNIVELWFDGSCYVPLGDVFDEYVGDSVVYLQGPHANIRWVGTESGVAPYPGWNTLKKKDLDTGVSTAVHGDPDGDAWAPLECDTTLYNHNWFWAKKNERKRKSLQHLVSLYYRSVGRGATFLLNSTPNTDGLIPGGDVARYKEFGEELEKRFSNPLGKTKGRGFVHTIRFDKLIAVNQFMIMEDYREGHRIREFVVEARTADGTWVELNQGTAVGRKRIVMFEPVEVTAVTLRITKNVHEPIVRDFKVYFVEGDNAYLYEPASRPAVVSRHAAATASDEHSAPYVAGKICDGNAGTWWGVSTRTTAPYDCWVELDLGRACVVNETAFNEPWNRTEAFQLEYRNDKAGAWQVALKGGKMGANYRKTFEPVAARYWRLHTLQANHYPSIREWELFSPSGTTRWQTCQTVEAQAFKNGETEVTVDLSGHIEQPGQFLLRFHDVSNAGTTVEAIRVFYDGNAVHEQVLSAVKAGEIYLLNRHALAGIVVNESRQADGNSIVEVVDGARRITQLYEINLADHHAPAATPDEPHVQRFKSWGFGAFLCYNSNQYSGTEFCSSKNPVADFKPSDLDVRQWVQTLKAAGMRYAVLTARHTSPFLLWDSATSECDSMAAIGKDIVGEYVRECRREGIAPGIYYCLWGQRWRPNPNARAIILAQLHELATNYGKIPYFWLDMPHQTRWLAKDLGHQELYDALKNINPECVIILNNNIQDGSVVRAFPTDVINGEMRAPPPAGHEPFRTLGGKPYYIPFEYEPCSQQRGTKHGGWDYPGAAWFTYGEGKGFEPSRPRPAEFLYRRIRRARDRGADNVLLSCAPDHTGRFRQADVEQLVRLGRMLKNPSLAPPRPLTFGCKAEASGTWDANYSADKAFDDDPDTRWGGARDTTSGWLAADLGQPKPFSKVTIREGWDRIRKFELQVRKGDAWQTIHAGTSVGEDYAAEFEKVEVQHVRLSILEATDVPTIWEVGLE